jgi:hypothetical protein
MKNLQNCAEIRRGRMGVITVPKPKSKVHPIGKTKLTKSPQDSTKKTLPKLHYRNFSMDFPLNLRCMSMISSLF